MAYDFTPWVESIIGRPAGWFYGVFRDKVWIWLGPLMSGADKWLADNLDTWRKAAADKGQGLGKVEIVVIAFLLVQVTPVAAGLPAALSCSFSAAITSWLPLFGYAPLCSAPGLAGHASALALSGLAAIGLWALLRWSLAVLNDIQASRAKVTTAPERPTRALIMGLSEWPESRGGVAAAAAEASNWAGRWQDYIKPATPGGNWQQSLRRIAASINELEVIYVLPSRESARQLDAFVAYAGTIFGRDNLPIRQVTAADGQPFGAEPGGNGEVTLDYDHKYDVVSDGLKRAVELVREAFPHIGRRETCIDITAGQKIFSIAGGVLTLNSGLTFSYVTSFPGKDPGIVKYYDAELVFPERLHSMFDRIRN